MDSRVEWNVKKCATCGSLESLLCGNVVYSSVASCADSIAKYSTGSTTKNIVASGKESISKQCEQ